MSHSNIPYTIDLPTAEECIAPPSPFPYRIVRARLAHTVFWKTPALFIHDLRIGSLGPTLRPASWQSELRTLITNRARQSWEDEKSALIAIVRSGVLHQSGDGEDVKYFDERWQWEKWAEEWKAESEARLLPDGSALVPGDEDAPDLVVPKIDAETNPLADQLIQLIQDAVDALALLYPSFVKPPGNVFYVYDLRCVQDDLKEENWFKGGERKILVDGVAEAAAELEEEEREVVGGHDMASAGAAGVTPQQQEQDDDQVAPTDPVSPQEEEEHAPAVALPVLPAEDAPSVPGSSTPTTTASATTSTKRARDDDDVDDIDEPSPKRPCLLASPLPPIHWPPPPHHPPRIFYPGMPAQSDHADEPLPRIPSPPLWHVPRVFPDARMSAPDSPTHFTHPFSSPTHAPLPAQDEPAGFEYVVPYVHPVWADFGCFAPAPTQNGFVYPAMDFEVRFARVEQGEVAEEVVYEHEYTGGGTYATDEDIDRYLGLL